MTNTRQRLAVSSKRIAKVSLITCSLLTAHCLPSFAAGEPDAFALNGVGARQGGMGGAFIGLSDSVESVYYNPAGLGNLTESGLSTMYQTPMLDTSREFFAVNKAWDHPMLPGSIALGWLRLASKNIELTNTDEQVLGTDNLSNDLLLLGIGVHPFEHYSFGMTVKYFRFAFDGFKETGVGYDVGMHGQYGFFRFGVAMTDLNGTTLHGNSIEAGQPDATDTVPMRLRPGIAVVFNKPFGLPLDFDWDGDELIKLQDAQEPRVYTGMEFWGFEKRFALRTGYQEASGPSLGAGVRIGRFTFDYSYLFSLHLEDENRLGVAMRF